MPVSERGSAAIEIGLLLPWMIFSFIAVIDFGFASYGLIATQNAARAAATWGASSSANAQSATLSTQACTYALAQLQYAPGVGSSVSTCSASPVSVTATYHAAGSDGLPTVAVKVTYTVQLMAIPLMMPGSLAINRTVELPVRN
jgi:Flp pilus assembly protein TadG